MSEEQVGRYRTVGGVAMTNSATRSWEYDHPSRVAAESRDEIPCPKCDGRLQWQNSLNLACLECESGFGIGSEGSRGGVLLIGEAGHPAGEALARGDWSLHTGIDSEGGATSDE